MSDSSILTDLVKEVKNQADVTCKLVENLTQSLSSKETVSSPGLSFLELKNILLLDYMSNLTYVMLRKSFGETIENETCIERLVENRTVLEKMRPVEKKLKYQIDKYAKIADDGFVPGNDPLHFKPNPEALEDDDENDSDVDSLDEQADGSKDKKYVAPKHVPTFYDEHDPANVEMEESIKRQKRMLSRGMIDDLKRQHFDTPEEVFDMETFRQSRQAAKEREKTRFEEENFMRLPTSKKDKQDRRKRSSAMTIGNLGDEVTHDFGKSNFDGAAGPSRKRKGGSRGNKKSSKRKKFRKH